MTLCKLRLAWLAIGGLRSTAGRKHSSHQRLSPLCGYTSGTQRDIVHLICSQSLNSTFGGCIHLLMLLCTVCACMHCMCLESICQCALACFNDLACACLLSVQACEYGCVFRLGVGEQTFVTLTYECDIGVIWMASILLSNATECPREMSPFHTDNRI